MISAEINAADLADLNRLVFEIGEQAPIVLRRALSRTIRGAKTDIAKNIGRKVTLKSAYIKSNIKSTLEVSAATGFSGKIIVNPGGKNTPLMKFTTNPNRPQRTRRGVTVKVWRDRAPVRFKKAFVAKMPTGHVGIFQRKKQDGSNDFVDRLGIEEFSAGPSIASVYLNTPGLKETVETAAAERLQIEIDRQLAYALSRL